MAEKTITATKLRRDLGAVLDAVARGQTVHITRQGRPLCTLVPPSTKGAESTAPAPEYNPPITADSEGWFDAAELDGIVE